MTARHKLNAAYVAGALVVAGFLARPRSPWSCSWSCSRPWSHWPWPAATSARNPGPFANTARPQPHFPKGVFVSHIVTVKTRVTDPRAVEAACQRLGLPQPAHGTARLYSGEATGLLVPLPGWQYPVVIDTQTGAAHYDNYQGRWGDQKHLDRFLQVYAVEKARLEARKRGYGVVEQTLADGSIMLRIVEGS